MDILVVTGQSGAGKSTSLQALEDLGFYCVDNVPAPLLHALVDLVVKTDETRRLAAGIDARESSYLREFPATYRALIEAGHDVDILFLEAKSEVLVRRYVETRRKHPMGELPQGIELESDLLAPIRSVAAATIDTSNSTGRQLRQIIRDRYGQEDAFRLVLMSFGFRHGRAGEADVILDCRFLRNPYDDPVLRSLSGLHNPVAEAVLAQPDAREFLQHAEPLLAFLSSRAATEGRSHLTVALGCTGGQHRSVALVEELRRRLSENSTRWSGGNSVAPIVVRHRDVGKA